MRSSLSAWRVGLGFLPLLVEQLETRIVPSFVAALAFDTGSPSSGSPFSIALGDVNGDGLFDIAVANYLFLRDGGDVGVLLGNGDGTFQSPRNFSAGNGPCFVAIDDLNGDGLLDRAAANFRGNTVSVLLGNGDGSFQTTHASYLAGSMPRSLAVEDFNGDGFPDLAVANQGSHDVSLLLNGGVWTSPGGGPGAGHGPSLPDLFATRDLGRLTSLPPPPQTPTATQRALPAMDATVRPSERPAPAAVPLATRLRSTPAPLLDAVFAELGVDGSPSSWSRLATTGNNAGPAVHLLSRP